MGRTSAETSRARDGSRDPSISIVIPCLDEGRTIASVVDVAQDALRASGIPGEVLVVDNGSTDRSVQIAEAHGARVIDEPTRGYGSALRRGCQEATGDFIVMGDADESYDFSQLGVFIDALRDGADLVMGTRTRGEIAEGAMPWKNRYIGNPVSTRLLNKLFGSQVSDVHCGMRAFTKSAFEEMDLRTTGMEFASEMVIRAAISDMDIREVPIRFLPDGRDRPPHLRPWRDGWRHLKTILLFSPTALFLIPGSALLGLGLLLMTMQLLAPMQEPLLVFGLPMDFHWAILGSLLALVGYQIIIVSLFARMYGMARGFRQGDRHLTWAFEHFTLERVLIIGLLVTLAGICLDGIVVVGWLRADLGPLVSGATRVFILGSTLVALGVQTIFSAFFFSLLRDEYAFRTERVRG